MFIRSKGRILFLFFLIVISISLFSNNPFLGGEEGKAIPAVRPPTSGGFMVEKQLEFREIMGNKMTEIKNGGEGSILWGILGLAFIYGMLHAAGPGHRKTVIFSIFLSRKAKWYEPFLAAFLSAAVHGGTAFLLVLIFQFIFNRILSVQVNRVSSYLEGISYILLMAVCLWFIIRETLEIIGFRKTRKENTSHKGLYTTLIAASFFPCPGVIMIMTFSAALGVLSIGVLSIITLSAGMGITISFAAYLAYFGREGVFSFLKMKEKTIARVSTTLELGSFIFLFFFSLWMAYPFLSGLIPVDL